MNRPTRLGVDIGAPFTEVVLVEGDSLRRLEMCGDSFETICFNGNATVGGRSRSGGETALSATVTGLVPSSYLKVPTDLALCGQGGG